MKDNYDFDLLCQQAYQSWLDRGQPLGTPENNLELVKSLLGMHEPITTDGSEDGQSDQSDDA